MKTSIIPDKQIFAKRNGDSGLNLKAICIFVATGFFLEADTYFNNLQVLQPATDYKLDENNTVKSSTLYWKWHYSPRDISLKHATEEFAHLFEGISKTKLANKKVILPLSGGLDSRTQAAMFDQGAECVASYSYKFEDGFDETKYGCQIAKEKNFSFNELVIPKGYLWEVIDQLSDINKCYADFTSPRQMAVIEEISKLGSIFFLGHWGDVLFDDMGVDDSITFDEQVKVLKKKIIKKGGAELANALWNYWGLDGNFEGYFVERISELLKEIEIDNANARIRAFKSMYWASRWTTANMGVFSEYKPVVLPYYDDEMCKFICSVPEKLLAGRQIQIEYIKMKCPGLAKITWQSHDPFNLYDYKKFTKKGRLPARILKRGKKMINENLFGKKLNTRNWEIQFTGDENDERLRRFLLENKSFTDFVSMDLIRNFYDKFKNENSLYYSHSVNMLLTLSLFCMKK